METKGKIALVTGSAHRVGKAIAMELAQAGAHVAIHYHTSSPEAEETAQEARTYGVDACAVQADLSDWQQVRAMVSMVEASLGMVDILVNSASRFEQTRFPTDDLAGWHREINLSVNAPFYCANAVVHGMLERGEGAIVNIVDLSAWQPWPGFTAHSVGKAALMALTRQLAVELAPKVRVNAVAPGPVLAPPDYSEEKIARAAKRTLLKRWGSPRDVSQAVLFLIQADYITGDVIVVDGGERYGGQDRRC